MYLINNQIILIKYVHKSTKGNIRLTGIMMTQGTLVDAKIIQTPSSIKNKLAIYYEYLIGELT